MYSCTVLIGVQWDGASPGLAGARCSGNALCFCPFLLGHGAAHFLSASVMLKNLIVPQSSSWYPEQNPDALGQIRLWFSVPVSPKTCDMPSPCRPHFCVCVCVCVCVGGTVPLACGALVPQPGIKLRPLAMKAQSPNHWSTREFPGSHFFTAVK